MSNQTKPVCRYCHSVDVGCTGATVWAPSENAWVLAGTYDDGWCNACGEENKYFDWVPVTPEENER
jgi:hypothetical protein